MAARALAFAVLLLLGLACGPAAPRVGPAGPAGALGGSSAVETPTARPSTPASFATVRRQLYAEIFHDQRETLYCGCAFDALRVVDFEGCGYAPRRDGPRARRVEVEHVVPASWIGEGRSCWIEPSCRRADGTSFRGRECCMQTDRAFRSAHNDLHNLWPAIGEINNDRADHRFAELTGEPGGYGRCDIVVDRERRRVRPRAEIRGDIARMALYMAEIHGVRLSDEERRMFRRWHRDDPPDDFERRRNERIRALQGNGNRLVDEAPEDGLAAAPPAAALETVEPAIP